MLELHVKKPGRPVSIDKKVITKKCLEFYSNNGIDNKSFNDVIKYAGVSKGTIYRLYGNEDSLQKSVLTEYFNTTMKERLTYWSDFTVREFIMDVTSGLITNRYKPCLYFRAKMRKYKLGRETRRFIGMVDNKLQAAYISILRNDLIKKNKEIRAQDIKDLADFLINSIATIHVLRLNNSPHKLLSSFSKKLLNNFN